MHPMTDEQRGAHIAALVREREQCETRGLEDRVKQIEKQLRLLGAAGAPPNKRTEKRPAVGAREQR
jgi:hypothetical protein